MASTLATPVAQAISLLFDGNLGRLLNYGLRPGYGLLGVWNPLTLFTNGEQGVWYDPSDFSTMFQDSAGTMPVTAVEQPVGLILDKSKGLVLGAELVTNGGPFTNTTGWNPVNSAVLSVSQSEFILNAVIGTSNAQFSTSTVIGKVYLVSFTARKAGIGGGARISINGVVDGPTNTTTTNQNLQFVFTATGVTSLVSFNSNGGAGNYVLSSISVRELPGNHAYQTTSTSRPVLRQDAGGRYYLSFDGVDDSLSTASIDFSGGDKMTVVAGVRKLSDAVGFILETGTGVQAGSFHLVNLSATQTQTTAGGSALISISAVGFTNPSTFVVTMTDDISGDLITLRRNGSQVASGVLGQGTGNFGNLPLYLGMRTGTAAPWAGHLYSLIVRGAQSSEAQILSAETYCNQKTGAY